MEIVYIIIAGLWLLAALAFLAYQVYGFYLGHEYGGEPRENGREVLIAVGLVLISPLWLVAVLVGMVWGAVKLFKDVKQELDTAPE